MDKRIKIVPPFIVYPYGETKKRSVNIVIFFSPRCPVCKKIIECETSVYGVSCKLRDDTPFYKALKDASEDIDISVRLVNVETYEGSVEADESGVEYVPTIFINAEPIDPRLTFNYQVLINILYGREPPPIPNRFDNLTRRIRQTMRWGR